jgi:Asp/Glu/hydantoin racemase
MTRAATDAGFLGILMLDTRFPRPLGDIGHPGSFELPVRYRVVPGASPQRVVHDAARGLLGPFIAAAQALVDQGARAIATGCGFLVLHQAALQAALTVPVWSSALLALPALAHARPGVLTADAAALGAAHLRAAGAAVDTPIEGLAPGCAFQRTLLEDLPTLCEADARTQVVAAATRLVQRHPEVGAIVLECTNLPPHADAVRQATGRPVHDVLTLLHARWHALTAA